jgi:sulfide:quinone oxidoreductase
MSFPERALRPGLRLDSRVESREVLIVGGGIAGIEALMALADLGDSRLRLRLVAAHPSFVLRPQIVGVPWGGEPLRIDLERLCRAFGADFRLGTVTGVDPVAHRVHTAGGATLGYERLLLAPGARPALPYRATRVLGFGALPHTLADGLAGSVAILVPAGTTWTLPAYELALLAAAAGRDVRVVTAETSPLEAFGPGAQAAACSWLDRHGVGVETGHPLAAGSDPGDLADTVISLPLLSGSGIVGVELDQHGFVRVDDRLAVVGAEHVHAAGDATAGPVKQGGLAGQQADTAATEIVRSCAGAPPDCAYDPVLRGKLTAADGEELYLRRALDGADPGRVSSDPLWQPSGIVCAWRLSRWLAFRRGELEQYTVDHVARPATVSA